MSCLMSSPSSLLATAEIRETNQFSFIEAPVPCAKPIFTIYYTYIYPSFFLSALSSLTPTRTVKKALVEDPRSKFSYTCLRLLRE